MSETKVAEVLASECPLALDPKFIGSCPCARIEGAGFVVDVHCWRVCSECQFSGVHVDGLSDHVGFEVATHVYSNNGWTNHTDWTLVVNGKSFDPPTEGQ